jgi:hypothetical protein
MRPFFRCFLLPSAALLSLMAGCGVRTPLDVGWDGATPPRDGGIDASGPCARPEDCDDGLVCNGRETCVGGRCVPGMPIACADDLECTIDMCLEEERGCVSVPDSSRCPPGTRCDPTRGCVGGGCTSAFECDDGRFCNGVEECRDGICTPGSPPRCDDGVSCTVDTCSELWGGCTSTPNSSRCPMGEICDPARGCVVRRCRPGSSDCDDGFVCNGTETCSREGRCLPGEPLDCDDFEACTLDRCEEGLGCISEPRSPFEICGNGVDDDCDLQADCDDFECHGTPGCPSCVPRAPTEVDCFDRVDDDCDMRIDCDDSDCARVCMRIEICDDRRDNDGDGLIDCADPDCRTAPRCALDAGVVRAELGIAACTNGADDDGDGRIDCRDPDCTPLPGGECCNGIDDNGDGLVDIATCRCFDDALCAGVGNLDQVCWEDSFSICLPRCNFYGAESFCRMWFPDRPRCNRMTGECMP